jgi:diaminohydroxyphosphoribosylaminopyrimidine deaminase/5-amino-6-(5-phosphoribosylamino)uracil reductase
MRLALRLARRGYGATSPNPMVGAVLVKGGRIIGRGWHRRAGLAHGEIEALRDAQLRGENPRGATLYVTLEPCSTHGRTPPCAEAIIAAGIKRVVVGTIDPNPRHAGAGLKILKRAGVEVITFDGGARHSVRAVSRLAQARRARSDTPYQRIAEECEHLNEAFNHWIVHRTPFVTVKAGMTLDGKIATAAGESKWITSGESREFAMHLRRGVDAILVGVNTVMADDPGLTVRDEGNIEHRTSKVEHRRSNIQHPTSNIEHPRLRRIVLDSMARTPLTAKVVRDEFAGLTTIVVSRNAPQQRVKALKKLVSVLVAPQSPKRNARSDASRHIDLRWLLKKLGAENVTSVLVEGGGEVHESFLVGGLAQRVAFFYAPKVIGGRDSRKAVAGEGIRSFREIIELKDIEWRKIGQDLFMTGVLGS